MSYIIDAHAHIFPQKIASKASVNIGAFYDLAMCFDGSVATLLEEGEKNNIDKFVIQSVATVPNQVSHINNFIADSVAAHPDKFIGFASLHPAMENMEQEIERVISLGLKGIKLHPDFQKFAINSKEAYKIFELIEGRLPVLVHTGDFRYKYSNPDLMAEAMRDFPKMKVIAAHFGGWSEWENAEKELVPGENLYVDTSSSLYALTPEKALELVHHFGDDNVFFGTDYPMWDAGKELEFIDKMNMAEELKDKILYKNICRMLDITL